MARLSPVVRSERGGVVFSVRSDDPVATAGLRLRWRHLPRVRRRPDLLLDASFRARRARLCVDGRSRLHTADPSRLLAELELALYAELVARTSATPLHAAAVVLGGRAVLIAGDSGAGKSSLAWELSRAGTYLGEEHAFLHEDGRVSGFPRALSLGVRVAWPERVQAEPAPVGLVVLLETPRGAREPRLLTPAEGAAGLARHLHRPPRARDLARLVRLAGRAPVVELAREGLERAAADVIAALDAPRADPRRALRAAP